MTRKRKKYSREFKQEALRVVDESDKSVAQVARELGIRADLLYSWKSPPRQSAKFGGGVSGQRRRYR